MLLTNAVLEDILPGYGDFPECFRSVIPYLLASLIFHEDFLSENLSPAHPLFVSRVWTTGTIESLRPHVLSGCGTNFVSMMSASGIPPTLIITNEMEKLKEEMNDFKKTMKEQQDSGFANITHMMKDMPNEVSIKLRESLEINGVVQVTYGDVMRIVANLEETMLRAFQNQGRVPDVVQVPPAEAIQSRSSFFQANWIMYRWSDGSEQYFPEDFIYPKGTTVSIAWDLFYFGRTGLNEAPYRKLMPMNIKTGTESEIKTQKSYMSKAVKVIKAVAETAVIRRDISKESDLFKMNYENSRLVFRSSFQELSKRVYNVQDDAELDRMRITDVTYLRFYDLLMEPNRTSRKRRLGQ